MPLPPYAPELNPVEQLWLNIKQRYLSINKSSCLFASSPLGALKIARISVATDLFRTKVAKIFANEDSCLRLVSAVVMEISDEWQSL
jgi:hypothetical protein